MLKMAKKTSPQKSRNTKRSKGTLLNIFDKNFIWEDRDEVLDAIYWFRQILALVLGIVWGFLGLTGYFGTLSYIVLSSLVAYGVSQNSGYEFDPDENLMSVKEGFMTTFATFLVSWIVTYTAVHFSQA